jgi:carbonic anhydrase
MDHLIEGYRRFRAETWPAQRDRYERLATRGQRPHTMVVACSDSRVDPQTVFGAVPGELFVVRNVAGLVPPFERDSGYHGTSAAVEFAVRVLGVGHVVVLGHAQCGGVMAMLDGPPTLAPDFVEAWMKIAEPALDTLPPQGDAAERLLHCETEVVRLSLANLMTFPWLADRARAGRLTLHGYRFDIHSGILARLQGSRFVALD